MPCDVDTGDQPHKIVCKTHNKEGNLFCYDTHFIGQTPRGQEWKKRCDYLCKLAGIPLMPRYDPMNRKAGLEYMNAALRRNHITILTQLGFKREKIEPKKWRFVECPLAEVGGDAVPTDAEHLLNEFSNLLLYKMTENSFMDKVADRLETEIRWWFPKPLMREIFSRIKVWENNTDELSRYSDD